MNWIPTAERQPERVPNQVYSQVACLVYRQYSKSSQIEILVFNHEHECWDDSTGDDYECEIGRVSHWMPLPESPITKSP